jgi:TonB family protein
VLEHTQSGEKHEVRSDPSGHFQLAGLTAGDYQLKTGLVGFATEQGRVALKAGQHLQQDVVLQVGSLQETITTTGPPDSGAANAAAKESARGKTVVQPRSDPCSQSAAGGCITPPTKVRDARPRYPRQLWEAGTGGIVKIEARIGTDGFLKELRVLAPADPDLANAATEAVGQWQYSQTRLDGVPIEVRVNITVRFSPQ